MLDIVGQVIRTTRFPNSDVQTNADLITSINAIGSRKAQLDCRSHCLRFLARELGFSDFCYPHEADYIPGMSEDAHWAKKWQKSLSADPIADGGEGDGSISSDGCSPRKCPKTSDSGTRVREHPSVKGGDSSASGTGGHI